MREYRERLYVPLSWWLLAAPSVLVIGVTVYAGLPWPWPGIILGGLAGGCAALLISLGQGRVEVGQGVVRAGGEALPLTAISEAVPLDEPQTIRLRGPRADPAAYLYSRPFLKRAVYLSVDPAAGVPYWLIGTRHPAELAAAVERCRVPDGHEPVA
ncbi:MAG TPA: DUF3093 domain-containing protein [Streptosporangiaceae bacterium]|nr:DUF3093 domain-containing protein [Streptosporangiaceae bacterium]